MGLLRNAIYAREALFAYVILRSALAGKLRAIRLPDGRRSRVQAILQGRDGRPGRCSRHDDKFVKEAKCFLLQWRNDDETIRRKLTFQNPGLRYAYEFHQRIIEDPENAMYIEARLLARQTPEQIAGIMGMIPDAIRRSKT